MIDRRNVLIGGAALGAGLTASSPVKALEHPDPTYWNAHDTELRRHAATFGTSGVAVVSDSFGYGIFSWERLGGLKHRNISYSGARMRNIFDRASYMLPLFRPDVILFWVGANNVGLPVKLWTDDEWINCPDECRRAFAAARALTPRVAVLAASPWEGHLRFPLEEQYLLPIGVNAVNIVQRSAALEAGVTFVEETHSLFAQEDGFAKPGTCLPDKVHLTGGSYEVLRPVLDATVAALLAANPL